MVSTYLRAIFGYFLVFIAILIFIIPLMLCTLLPEKYRYDNPVYYYCLYILFWCVLKFTFLPIEIVGKENLPKQTAIFVGNHQSSLDIPVLAYLSGPKPSLWVVLEYYAKQPVLGFFVRRMNITVDRDDTAKSARSLIKILRFLKDQERNLLIFPEAGRFNDSIVHRFLPGFAVIAKKLNRPVTPVFMPNNGKIYPPGSFLMYNYPIKAIVGPQFWIRENETEQEFSERVHNWFVQVSEIS